MLLLRNGGEFTERRIEQHGWSVLRHVALGTAVFGGMIAASAVGIFLIPLLYVIFQRVRERLKGQSKPAKASDGEPHPLPQTVEQTA